jgi:SWI/SNF-related matrix-associated actin-dependent regulator 1 of chromatin subfamily A
MKTLTHDGKEFIWRGDFETRNLPKNAGFRWDGARWHTPDADAARKLLGYADKASLEELIKQERQKLKAMESSHCASSDYGAPAPEGLSYLPYQSAFFEYAEGALSRDQRGVLLADEMGLGKTIQALGIINDHPDRFKKILIVCPATLKLNWKREAEKWLTHKHNIKILGTKKPKKEEDQTTLPTGDRWIAIINYDILLKLRPTLVESSYDIIICDESQNLKNYKAKRTQALLGGLLETGEDTKTRLTSLKSGFWLFLTGTPILNRPKELWTSVKKLDPDGLGASWKKFHMRYCGPKHNGFGWDFNGSSNLEELQEKLRGSIMVRRLKADVLKDLPAKRRRIIPLEVQSTATLQKLQSEKTLEETAERLRQDILKLQQEAELLGQDVPPEKLETLSLLKKNRGETIDIMTKNRQEIGEIKSTECLPLLVSHAEDHPILIFCHHHDTIDKVVTGLENAKLRVSKIDGRDSMEKRQATVDAFQAGEFDALVLQIQAAGVGLTLTHSSHVIFLEMDWTPGRMAQAEDRAHRVGQGDSVLVDYLVYDDSIDAHLALTLQEKEVVIAKAIDGKPTGVDIDAEIENLKEKARVEREKVKSKEEKEKETHRQEFIKSWESAVEVAHEKRILVVQALWENHTKATSILIKFKGGRISKLHNSFGKIYLDGERYDGDSISLISKIGIIESVRHLGFCACCGRELTDKESIRVGIGPTCLKQLTN